MLCGTALYDVPITVILHTFLQQVEADRIRKALPFEMITMGGNRGEPLPSLIDHIDLSDDE